MGTYIISESAKKDLENIWSYTLDTWSEEQAVRYYNKIMDVCEYIAVAGKIGRCYDEVCPGLRGIPCEHHIIFYRILSVEKVRIVRILHEKMDFPRHLTGSEL